jgi:hypothetical protein
MTEIAVQEQPSSALAPMSAGIGNSRAQQLADLQSEAQFLEVANGLAEQACKGQLVAAHFRGKPADGAIAIAFGSSLGWHWTKSLQDVYVVNGKPAIQSKEMRELLIRAGHHIEEIEVGPTKVILAGRRANSDYEIRVEWTIEKAKQAGYTSNKLYGTIPETMLYARCTTDLAKRLAPDALSGLGIVEDLQDRPVKVKSERLRGGTAGLGDALGVNDDTVPNVSDHATVEMITADQLKKLHAMFSDAGLGKREEGLAYLTDVVGHEVESSKDLTKAEASTVFEALERANDPEAQQ